jgi:hypothetical protein
MDGAKKQTIGFGLCVGVGLMLAWLVIEFFEVSMSVFGFMH